MNQAHASLNLQPIDDRARDGAYHLVSDGARFSVARWNGEAFAYSRGVPVEIEVTHWQAPEVSHG